MRIFKLKAFGRYQRREKLSDARLAQAVKDVQNGHVDADLGAGLIKQRIARAGRGKRGGYRLLMAYRRDERTVFLYGFAKSELDNIGEDELRFWRITARGMLELPDAAIEQEVADGEMMEVEYDE